MTPDKKVKILATLGPAIKGIDDIRQLVEAGVNLFRLNFSHGTQDASTNGTPSEIYDPATNRWSIAGNVIKFDNSTAGATCTQLADGSWLVAGGQSAAGNTILDQQPQGLHNETNAEIFDPRTLQWRRATVPVSGLVQPRYHHTAVRLRDGRVLLAGGCVASAVCADSV